MRPPPESARAAPRDPAWTRPFVWCDRCSTKLFVGEARCCRCGTERAGAFPAVEAGVGIAGRSNAVRDRAGSSPVGGERYTSGPLTRALVREHCRGAKRHVEWARGAEEPALEILSERERYAEESGQIAKYRANAHKHWLHAVVHVLRAALILVALFLCPALASAQTNVDRLMRTAWSECGVDCAPHEIAALHDVIAGIAERASLRWSTAWRLASPRLAAGAVSRAWLADITERCEEPEGWPEHVYEREGDVLVLRPHAPWSAFRARCLALAVTCRAVLAGEVASQCSEVPRVWGDEHDRERGEARGRAHFVEVDCGDTALVFGSWLPIEVD